MTAKQNDKMLNYPNYNNSNNEGLLIKRPSYSEPRISPGDPNPDTYPSENSAKNALTKVKEVVSEHIQHTPPPPSHNSEDIDQDEKQGIKCTFEKPCAWKYDKNVTGDNFEVRTGLELKEMNLTGLLSVN